MLIPKIITTFITIIFFIVTFSILFFILEKIPRAEIEITFKPFYKPSNTISLCQLLITKYKNCLENIAKGNVVCAEEIKNEIKNFYSNFEIDFLNYKISNGKSFEEIYECKFFMNSKEVSFLVKT